MRNQAARGSTLVLLGGLVGCIPFIAGCGDAVEDGSSVPFNQKADMSRQDAMRAAMSKDKGSKPKGKAAGGTPQPEQKAEVKAEAEKKEQ